MVRISKPPEERKREIIETARKLFFEKGFEKTMMSDISQEMKVAQGLVYRYFKSKNELLYAVVDQLVIESELDFRKQIELHPGTAYEKLVDIITKSTDEENNSFKLITEIGNELAIIEHMHSELSKSVLPILIELIEFGNQDGSWNCGQPELIAKFIVNGARTLEFNCIGDQELLLDIITKLLNVPSDKLNN